MGIALGLTAALCWGVADFLARAASRRVGSYRTSFYLQVVGLALMSLYLAAWGGMSNFPRGVGWQTWAFAAGAGVLNAICSVALYQALEVGILAVVAPIASSYAALTVILSMLSGERFTALRGVGIAATIAGVALACTARAPALAAEAAGALEHAPKPHQVLSRGVGWAMLASLGYGFLFWMLGYHVIPALGGMFTVWVMRLVTLVVLATVGISARQSLQLPRGSVRWLLVSVGVTDTAAFVANNLGLKVGPVGVVTVLVSLFSAVTVLLAWVLLREKLDRRQWLGVLMIFAGIVLVSA